ncbi:Fc.00g022440.m01.CDS01 [Cosmosporella sp. VM-42]
MSHPKPAPGTGSTSNNPAWSKSLVKRIKEEREADFSDATHHEIVRDMLLAPDDDDSAVPRQSTVSQKNYIAGFASEDFGMRKHPEYTAGDVLNSILLVVFETGDYVPFRDMGHDRLTNLHIGIKQSAAQKFNPDV